MVTTMDAVAPRAPPNPIAQNFTLSASVLTPLLAAFVVESLLFGIHATLFFVCVRILLGRRESTLKVAMLTAVVVMFGLATVDVAISWHIVLQRRSSLFTGTTKSLQKAIHPKFIIHLIDNGIADFLLLTRCYVVWGNRKIVLYIGGFGLGAGTLCGIITGAVPKIPNLISAYILIVLGFNFILTVLMAGRIMWVAREVKKVLGPRMASYYHFSVGILVESGMIYTVSMLLLLIFAESVYIVLAAVIVLRVVCIVPILIIVQIALGQSTDDVQSTVIKFQGGTQQIVLDTIVSEGYDLETEGNHEQFREVEENLNTTAPKS